MSYANIAQVKARIGGLDYSSFGFTDNASFESYISDLIDRCSRLVDRYCGVPDGFFYGGARIEITIGGRNLRIDSDGNIYYQVPYPHAQVWNIEVSINVGDDENPVWSTARYIYDTIANRIYFLDQPSLILKQSIRLSMNAGFTDLEPIAQFVVVESVASFLLEYIRFLRNERLNPPVLELKMRESLDPYRYIPVETG